MTRKNFPDPEEIGREFEDFIKKRFGGQVQIFTHEMPGMQASTHAPEDEKIGSDGGGDGDGSEPPEDELESEELGCDEEDELDAGFTMTPKQLSAKLDRFVIGQDEAKKALAIAVCDHYRHIAHRRTLRVGDADTYQKQNVLILGPTGTGKTYLVRQIADLLGVPFVKADATRFSETGYMGANVEDLIKDLVAAADGDLERASYGIVYLDEADKLAQAGETRSRDVSGRGVQMGLLKLMEETEVDLKSVADPASQMQAFMEMQRKGRIEPEIISTRHILFIVSGAFSGLDQIIERRVGAGSIGFAGGSEAKTEDTPAPSNSSILAQARTEDYVRYGFEPEFVGRLPVRVAVEPLGADELFAILKEAEASVTQQYVQAFAAYGISARFEDDALRAIAKEAVREKTGARALMTVCEKILRDYKYELPSSSVRELVINEELVRAPQETLQRLLARAAAPVCPEVRTAIAAFEETWGDQHNLAVSFDEESARLISERVEDPGGVAPLCDELLANYEHGLKLISQNSGRRDFVMDANVVRDPAQALERMVMRSYEERANTMSAP